MTLQTHIHITTRRTLSPSQLPAARAPAAFVSLNGELFVASGFGAFWVVLKVVALELVIAAATLVVVVLSEDSVVSDEEEELELSFDTEEVSEALAVSVKVDFCVIVLP